MRASLVAAAVALLAGCTLDERYLVDGAVLQLAVAPPLATRVDATHRVVGDIPVAIECASPPTRDEGAIYRGVVDGPAGRWSFSTKEPPRRDGLACDDPAALDEAAEAVAMRYRKSRAALPAVRELSGERVWVRQGTLLLDTRMPHGAKVSVSAGAPNVPRIIAGSAGAFGAILVGVGALLFSQSSLCGKAMDCALGSLGRDGAITAIAGGGIFLAVAAVLALVSGSFHPQEIPAHLEDHYYYRLPLSPPPALDDRVHP
jgi:hypothetical protein